MRSLIILFTVLLIGFQSLAQAPVTYKSKTLKITSLRSNVFIHTSYLVKYKNYPCNGMIYVDNGEAIIIDTPTDEAASRELIEWVENELNCKVKAIVTTHFHVDCLGGLEVFHQEKISSYASALTVELARQSGESVPQNAFDKQLNLSAGDEKVVLKYFGAGHTQDNIVVYIPKEEVLFGGCLIKSLKARKGNLKDASTNEWSATVQKIQEEYPDLKFVIPGHGKSGGTDLLDYTIELFSKSS